jgi:hypothetical protein
MTSTAQPLSAYGISFAPPDGWSATISKDDDFAPEGTVALPIVHVCTLPLPDGRGAFGGGLVQYLGPSDCFMALVEYLKSDDATLFDARTEVPTNLSERSFKFNILQRTLEGQGGCQLFFGKSGRYFSLYIVLGDITQAPQLLPEINGVLASIEISPQ